MDDLGLREDWEVVRRGLPTKAVGPNTAAVLAAVARIDARFAASHDAPRLTPDREALAHAMCDDDNPVDPQVWDDPKVADHYRRRAGRILALAASQPVPTEPAHDAECPAPNHDGPCDNPRQPVPTDPRHPDEVYAAELARKQRSLDARDPIEAFGRQVTDIAANHAPVPTEPQEAER